MNAVLIMIDSLNRTYLTPYGNEWIRTPSFERLEGQLVAELCRLGAPAEQFDRLGLAIS